MNTHEPMAIEYLPRGQFGAFQTRWLATVPQKVRWEVLIDPEDTRKNMDHLDGVVARIGGTIVGMVSIAHGFGQLATPKGRKDFRFVTPSALLLPEVRGIGVGQAMLDEVRRRLAPDELLLAELVDARRPAAVKLALRYADVVTPASVVVREFNGSGLPLPTIHIGVRARDLGASFSAAILERYAPVTVETAHGMSVWVLAHVQATLAHLKGRNVPLLDRLELHLRFFDGEIGPCQTRELLEEAQRKIEHLTPAQMERHVNVLVDRLMLGWQPMTRDAGHDPGSTPR
jgi:GNAT superfamily N-acetyltransferase